MVDRSKPYYYVDKLTPETMTRGIEASHSIITCELIMLFQLGFVLFEYGAVRSKNKETVFIKTIAIIAIANLATFTVGNAFAYGSPYFVGKKFYFSSFI